MKNNIGKGEAKELTHMTHKCELGGGLIAGGKWGSGQREQREKIGTTVTA